MDALESTGTSNLPGIVRSLRPTFKINNPAILLYVEFLDGSRTADYGMMTADEDYIAICEHIVCLDKNIPLPDIRDECRAMKAVIVIRDVRDDTVQRVSYPL